MRQFREKNKASESNGSDFSSEKSTRLSRVSPDVHHLLHLQRTVGNHAVHRMLRALQSSHDPIASSDGQSLTPDNLSGTELSSNVNEPARSSGQPLEPETRSFMEQRFGQDFSKVQVHTGAQAEQTASSLNARAYTIGSDIVFGSGEYAPTTKPGQLLIAHELAHVVQQQNAPVAGPRTMQTQVGDPSDGAELSADVAARAVMTPEYKPYRSTALQIRECLRSSSLAHPTIQRAVTSWGGDFDTDKYDLVKTLGAEGVDIDLKFKPNKYVDAELIGMTQTARSTEKGTPVPASTFYTTAAEKTAFENFRIPANEAAAGTMVDRLVSYGNPLYATEKPAAGDPLSAAPTNAFWGQHGWHYTDKAGKLQEQDAHLKDTPTLAPAMKESSQVFESTALAIKGVQEGTFYGSVQWGWQKDAAGTVNKLPLTLVSKDVPSATFARASEIWNAGKTSEGKETIDLPIVVAKYTNTQGVWLVSKPSQYQTTIIAMLARNTRLEVTDKGTGKPFNRTTEMYKWWKVTVVEGTHIGKVGWVMQADLSDAPTK